MSDLDKAYFDGAFAARFPDAYAEEIAEATPAKAPAAKPAAKKPAEAKPAEVGLGTTLADILAGSLKGAVAQAMGLTGDIRDVMDMVAEEKMTKLLGERSFMTTEEVRAMLPSVVPKTEDLAKAAAREAVAMLAEDMGTLLGPGAILKKGARKAAAKTVAGGTAAGAPAPATGKEINFDERGKRK